ncbi:MAG: HNH endonuclease [Cytophagales bacterium]|nr:MAG: HNH endonuclease [Cytophagales bacterium]
MGVYLSRVTRKLVMERAGHRCEYCRVPEYLSAFDYHIDHIIGLQHGGPNSLINLAYGCSPCNWKKGPNISTLLDLDGPLIALFNPRTQDWFAHFETKDGLILPLTVTGKATIKLLDLNTTAKVEERLQMALAGFYP